MSLLKNVAFALSAFAHLGLKLASLDIVELLQPPPRRQYAVEQILNAHSQIFLQHPFNVDFKGAAPFYIWGSLSYLNSLIVSGLPTPPQKKKLTMHVSLVFDVI